MTLMFFCCSIIHNPVVYVHIHIMCQVIRYTSTDQNLTNMFSTQRRYYKMPDKYYAGKYVSLYLIYIQAYIVIIIQWEPIIGTFCQLPWE